MSEEDDRAAEYRRTMVARERNKRAAERALSGDTAKRRELERNWEPVVLGLQEAREPAQEPCE